MQTVDAEAKRAGVSSVELMTARTNRSARALYESLGFTTDPAFLTYAIRLT